MIKIKGRLIREFYVTVGIPLVYLFNLVVIYVKADSLSLVMWLRLVGLIAAFGGMGLWTVSYLSLGEAFGVLPKKQKRVSRGLYRYVNHPMYMGIILTFLGLGVANQSGQGLVVTMVVVMPVLVIRGLAEEKRLIN